MLSKIQGTSIPADRCTSIPGDRCVYPSGQMRLSQRTDASIPADRLNLACKRALQAQKNREVKTRYRKIGSWMTDWVFTS